jgi:FACT complex subunit SSRP1/POB3
MASARTFDLKILLKMSPEIVFSSINKEEHELVEEFLKSKKLRVKNEMNDDMVAAAGLDSDSDEDMQSVASDGEDAPKPRPAAGNDEDSEEGTYSKPFDVSMAHPGFGAILDLDDDFQASSSDSGSPSESESDDGEGAVTASDDSGDRDLIKKTKPKKTKVKKDNADKAKGSKEKKEKKEKKGGKKPVDDGNPRPKKKAKKQDD